MVSIVYAEPVGGRRTHNFNNGQFLAGHVQANRNDLFLGVPNPNDDNYRSDLRFQRETGWSMDWKNRYKKNSRVK